MKKTYTILCFSTLFLCTGLSQDVFNFTGAGARSAAMAYAFIGIADDATAISWNPAGLSQLRNPELSFVADFEYDIYSYEDKLNSENSYYLSYNPTANFNYISFVYPFLLLDRNLALGISLQKQLDFNYSYSVYYEDQDEAVEEVKSKTNIYSISASAGYSILPFLALGITFNKWFSIGSWEEYIFPGNPDEDYKFSNIKYTGFNLGLGMLVNMEEVYSALPLRFGFRAKTPFTLSEDFTLSGRYEGEGLSRDLEMPFCAGLGLAYRLGNYFTIATDYELRLFEDKRVIYYGEFYDNLEYEDLVYLDYNLSRSNKNLNQFRLGLEYIFSPAKFSGSRSGDVLGMGNLLIPIRCGFKTNPTTMANYDYAGDPVSQVKGKSINLGFGTVFNKFSFDLAYEIFWYDIEYNDSDEIGSGIDNMVTTSMIVYFR